ncbi:MAG: 50S ribosomal protein L6 [Planctomycetes bacterium]|nr:50S ribosomal protein L6 [Planctomycetota bacterium]
MSRIGKLPLDLPQGVQATVDGQSLSVKGPKGTLKLAITTGIKATVADNKVVFERSEDTKVLRAMHGTTRALARNMVEGVTKGYSRSLEIVGVGYKAQVQGKNIALNVGFANTIVVAIPDAVTVALPDATHINISGMDKHAVGQLAANIRAVRKPEPYKGKGIRYAGEVVRKKAGKSATAGAAGVKK